MRRGGQPHATLKVLHLIEVESIALGPEMLLVKGLTAETFE
jgi:hypothetical protein